ncbi:ParA family protein [Psychrobacillus sp. L3]|uniref:ParA family protein n=1 Tax=Psychrobacillus sp. L3 TaxID=3236891 RepID=UPI0036F33E05
MKTIALFNNKGGVGKTTITTSLAYQLSRQDKKVLIIDLDPQSNTTQVVLDESQVERIYIDSSNALDRIKTIRDIYNPMRDSNEAVIGNVEDSILSAKKNNFNCDIIPSHLSLSEFEDTLSDAWSDLRANKLGGFRRTNWFIQLVNQLNVEYDYILLDLSPSLGALNRSVLLNVDYFVIPITGDIYNQYGIKNIGTWITNWIKIYNRSLGYLIDDYDEQTLAAVSINQNISLESYKKFLGYIISRAKTSKRGNGREQKIISYQQKHFDDIELTINEALKFATNNKIKNSLELGKITEIISLLTESQAQHKPPFARVSQMIALNQQWAKDSVQNSEYAIMRTFEDIAENIQRNIEVLDNV